MRPYFLSNVRRRPPRSCVAAAIHTMLAGVCCGVGLVFGCTTAELAAREGKKRIAAYVRYFNEERPRQGLDSLKPDDVYYRRKPLTKAA